MEPEQHTGTLAKHVEVLYNPQCNCRAAAALITAAAQLDRAHLPWKPNQITAVGSRTALQRSATYQRPLPPACHLHIHASWRQAGSPTGREQTMQQVRKAAPARRGLCRLRGQLGRWEQVCLQQHHAASTMRTKVRRCCIARLLRHQMLSLVLAA